MVEQHYRWDFIGLSTDTKPTPETSEKVVHGSTFYCSDTSKLYVYCKNNWYEKTVSGGGGTSYTAGTGIDITGSEISVDTNTIQPKLTAGTGIDITDNTISATGGGGPTVVQTTGTSTTDVISQDGVTNLLFESNNQDKVKIGSNSAIVGTSTVWCTAIAGKVSNASQGAVAIGAGGKISNAGSGGTSIGPNAGWHTSSYATSIGAESRVYQSSNGGVALGYNAYVNNARGSIAIGAKSQTTGTQGVMAIGTTDTIYGYNNSNYRLLTGLYDGQSNHDAATVAQGNTLASSAPTTTTVGVLGQLYTDTTNMHTYQCTAIDTTDPDNPAYTWTQRW